MLKEYPQFKAAAVQAGSVYRDRPHLLISYGFYA
jgi:hypothetical protein